MLLLPRVKSAGIHGDGYAECRQAALACAGDCSRKFRIMELLFQHT
jgi:hypothetical protein